MKNRCSAVSAAITLISAATFLAITENPSFAQRSRPTAVERRIERINSQLEQNERDNLNREKGSTRTNERTKALAEAQVREDFEAIQADYNRVVIAMADKQKTNYDPIFRAVAEINKRAMRLRENLALPKTKEEKNQNTSKENGSESLNDSLLMLRKHIYSFVTNPIFEAPTVLNIEQAEKASHDLDRIIKLSKSIEKKAN